MKTSTYEGKHGIQWTDRMKLDGPDFVDDLVLLSHTQQQMQEENDQCSSSLSSASTYTNENTTFSNTTRRYTNIITLDGEALEHMECFKYLVSCYTDEQLESDADVNARIGKATTAFLQLNKQHIKLKTTVCQLISKSQSSIRTST
ncbi:unnamed protein product [Schistosoma curassoni]|uniref:Uncharacterized protein n=1 Tax=Schistosoma curassoni TaxID=6186 RepID=A0A183JJQ3_9TREM|nr:unnamed protein product [Schistosoma curassoni]